MDAGLRRFLIIVAGLGCGLSPAFYGYFPDKEAVLEAVLDLGRAEFDTLLKNQATPAASSADELRALSARFIRGVRRNRDVLSLMWEVATRKMATRRPLSLERTGPDHSLPMLLGGAIERIVVAGIASGEFEAGNARLLAGLIASAHMFWLSPMGRQVDELVAIETLCEFELRALTR